MSVLGYYAESLVMQTILKKIVESCRQDIFTDAPESRAEVATLRECVAWLETVLENCRPMEPLELVKPELSRPTEDEHPVVAQVRMLVSDRDRSLKAWREALDESNRLRRQLSDRSVS